MQITITLNPGEDDPTITAAMLVALAGVYGGPAPVAQSATAPVAPEAPTERPHPLATSDQLIAQEARRAAGEPGGNTGTGTGAPASPSAPQERDSAGVPYDARIHTSGDTKTNQDGTWRKRRGVDDATYAAVLAEITAGGAPAAPLAPEAPAAPASPAEAPAAPVPAAAPDAPTPTPAPAVTASGPVAATVAGNGTPWPNFGAFVGAVSASRTPSPTYDKLNEVAGSLGVTKFAEMKDKPELWETFLAMISEG